MIVQWICICSTAPLQERNSKSSLEIQTIICILDIYLRSDKQTLVNRKVTTFAIFKESEIQLLVETAIYSVINILVINIFA